MKNKLYLLAIAMFITLSACALKDNSLGIVDKKRSQQEIDRMQKEKEEKNRLKNGQWEQVAGTVNVESKGNETGYIYHFNGLQIPNSERFAKDKEQEFELNFGKIFQISSVDDNEISDETEINNRKLTIEQLKSKGKVGDLTDAQKTIIKLLKSDASDDTTFNQVFKKEEEYNILLGLLQKGKSGVLNNSLGKVKAKYIEKNKLQQYRRRLGLKYSDFGVWNTFFVFPKSLDDNWKKLIKDSGKTKQNNEYFAMGDMKHKVNFVIDNEKDLNFTGRTIATVTKGTTNQNLAVSGKMKLSVSKGQGVGKFDLNFDGWYKFSLDKLNLSNNTILADAIWKVDGETTINDFKFKDNATKKVKDVTIKSAFFGDNKPEEIVGTYKFKTENSGDDFTVNGAFGGKQ